MLMLEHKGIEYERVELPTGLHPLALRLRGFAGNTKTFRTLEGGTPRMLGMVNRLGTVPALAMDGQLVKANRQIARFLDEVQPDPPLFPPEPDRRRAVEEAEAWGDDVLQMTARRLALAASRNAGKGLFERGSDGRLGPLLFHSTTMRALGRHARRFVFGRRGRRAGAPGAAPGQAGPGRSLDRIGSAERRKSNAADFMIAPSLALLCYVHDLHGRRSSGDRRCAWSSGCCPRRRRDLRSLPRAVEPAFASRRGVPHPKASDRTNRSPNA